MLPSVLRPAIREHTVREASVDDQSLLALLFLHSEKADTRCAAQAPLYHSCLVEPQQQLAVCSRIFAQQRILVEILDLAF